MASRSLNERLGWFEGLACGWLPCLSTSLIRIGSVCHGPPLLGGSWVVISGVISRVTILITHIRGLITLLTLLITTHEPPSKARENKP